MTWCGKLKKNKNIYNQNVKFHSLQSFFFFFGLLFSSTACTGSTQCRLHPSRQTIQKAYVINRTFIALTFTGLKPTAPPVSMEPVTPGYGVLSRPGPTTGPLSRSLVLLRSGFHSNRAGRTGRPQAGPQCLLWGGSGCSKLVFGAIGLKKTIRRGYARRCLFATAVAHASCNMQQWSWRNASAKHWPVQTPQEIVIARWPSLRNKAGSRVQIGMVLWSQ